MPFVDYLPRFVPSWLRRAQWGKFISALGTNLDAAAQRTRDAVKARFLATAPADAVKAIAGERTFAPGSPYAAGVSVESTASLRARAAAAWAHWANGGNAHGLLDELWDMGYRTMQVVIVGGKEYKLDGDRNLVITDLPTGGVGSWLIDTNRSFWSKVDVVFGQATGLPDVPEAPTDWSSGLPAEDSNEAKALKAAIRRWIPAMGQARVVIVTAGRCFGEPLGLTFGTLAGNGYGFSGNAVTIWNVD